MSEGRSLDPGGPRESENGSSGFGGVSDMCGISALSGA